MKTQFYLVVNSGGTVAAKKNRPNLSWNEVAIFVSLELPNQLFQKPQLSAQITVDERHVSPLEIDVETQNNIKEAIEAATGVEVVLKLENPNEI